MIYEEIQGYLIQAASPEDVAQFDAAYEVLKVFNVEDCLELFDSMLGEASGYGDNEAVDSLKTLMTNALRALMEMHSIQVHDDSSTLSVMIQLGQVLAHLQDWSQKQDILDLLSAEEQDTTESRFASLCGLVLGKPPENILIHLAFVSPSLLVNIKELMKPQEEILMPEFEAEIRQYLTDYARMRARVTSPSLWADFALTHPSAFGIPFELHLRRFLQERIDQLAQVSTEAQFRQLAEELIAIATISEERIGKALELVRRFQFEIYPDVSQSSKLDVVLATIYPEICRATP
jgi:hypothetical protein